jgi:cation:H+ antiporter
MMALTILTFIGGLVFLILGAEWLVRGAARLAAWLGISPLVIGLTVVAFGTSSPEMAVSIQSGFSGQADLAVGNVIGSNIFNVLFILGISAAITPLVVQQQLIRLDVPLMIGISLIVYLMALNRSIERLEGALLFAGVVVYTIFLIRQSRKEKNKEVQQEYTHEFANGQKTGWKSWLIHIGLVGVGLGLLVFGSNLLVSSAVTMARWLGLSELIIGLTIVSAGTSMPEVATSIAAAIKGERDIAVGNVVGSNIFNMLTVLGAAGFAAPGGLPVSEAVIGFDLPVMVAVMVATLPIFFTGRLIARWEGWVFLAYYAAYTAFLILDASEHDALHDFNYFMIWFAAPITLLTIGVSIFRELRARRAHGKDQTQTERS